MLAYRDDDDSDSRSALRDLLDSQGWRLLAREIQLQVDAHVTKLVETNEGGDQIRGQIKALRMVLQLPKTMIEEDRKRKHDRSHK